jgi:hypothetical protein
MSIDHRALAMASKKASSSLKQRGWIAVLGNGKETKAKIGPDGKVFDQGQFDF